MVPLWLQVLSIVSIVAGLALALAVTLDEMRRPQAMRIMNVVWPVTVLYGTVFGLWLYLRFGRAPVSTDVSAKPHHRHAAHRSKMPFSARVAVSTAHCGSACTLGDLIAEWLAFLFPVIAVWLGYRPSSPRRCSPSGSWISSSPLPSRPLFGLRLEVDSWEFWFMMQLAMLCGFLTSYPANWWLVRVGIKEPM